MNKKLSPNDPCWCGSGHKYKKCHLKIDDRIAFFAMKGAEVPTRSILKTKEQIEGIRQSSLRNIELLDYLTDYAKAGITTEELNRLAHEKTLAMGAIPAPLHYNGFTKSICTSIDEVVCHGIPCDERVLKEGDILNIDVSTIYKDYFSDSSRMFLIGEVSTEKQKLVRVAKECMDLGIEQVKPWGFLGDVGQAVNDHAKANGYSVVREIGGHGIGLEFHEEPWVSYITTRGTDMLLVPGMVFTVEPMINMGKAGVYTDEIDGWTVSTADGLPSAQWEKTVLVTDTGCEVLTY